MRRQPAHAQAEAAQGALPTALANIGLETLEFSFFFVFLLAYSGPHFGTVQHAQANLKTFCSKAAESSRAPQEHLRTHMQA